MKKIVIYGSTPAAVSAIEAIRSSDQESPIIFLSNEGLYPYNFESLSGLLEGKIKADKVLLRPKDFYEKNKVSCLLNKKMVRINFKRKKIFTEDKEQIEFDVLIMTDVPGYRFPEIKGNNKSGLYDIYSFKSIKSILDYFPVTESLVIQDDSLWGLKLALALRSRGKEVYYIAEENGLWSNLLTQEKNQWLLEALQEKGLQVILKNAIAEILGDSEAKAVRLKTGKVLACELIGFGSATIDFRPFSESELDIKEKITVDQNFRTNFEDIYAVGACCQRHPDHLGYVNIAEAEGKIVAGQILGQENNVSSPIFQQNLTDEKFTIDWLGPCGKGNSFLQSQEAWVSEKGYIKVWLEQNKIYSAVLINAPDKKALIADVIQKQHLWDEVRGQIFAETIPAQSSPDLQVSDNLAENIEQRQL